MQQEIAFNFPFDIKHILRNLGVMDKKAELDAFLAHCFAARIAPTAVCKLAGISPSTPGRWRANPDSMSARVLGKLEDALASYERGKL